MSGLVWKIVGTAGAVLIGGLAGAVFAPEPKVAVVLDGYEYRLAPDDRVALLDVVKLRAKQLQQRDVHLRADGEFLHAPGGELGYEVDIEAGVEAAAKSVTDARAAVDSAPAAWLSRRLMRQPIVVTIALPIRFDEDVARLRLEGLAERVNREPVDAALLIDAHRVVPSEWGARLSVDATLVRLASTPMADDLVVDAVVEALRPTVTEEDLAPVDVSKVLASFETSFRGKAGARAVNIRVAAKYLDGAVVLPGEVISFNSRVGRRVHGRGFVDAPVILKDELVPDVGGGVCQVATTLHGAAVYGNLTVVQRRSHSRPSGYAPLGLDATVVDGKVDLRIRNPYDEPILVHTSFPSAYKIRVELLGREPSSKVEHAYAVTAVEPFSRRVWFKEGLPEQTFDRKQKGSKGMDVVSVLRILHEDGSKERRTYRSKYYPVPEVFHAGPGTSASALPEMPKGAVSLVIDGEEVVGAGEPAGVAPDGGAGHRDTDVPTMDEADGLGRQGDENG